MRVRARGLQRRELGSAKIGGLSRRGAASLADPPHARLCDIRTGLLVGPVFKTHSPVVLCRVPNPTQPGTLACACEIG